MSDVLEVCVECRNSYPQEDVEEASGICRTCWQAWEARVACCDHEWIRVGGMLHGKPAHHCRKCSVVEVVG